MEDVVAAARRIEKVLEEQNDSKMERLITSMQDQIRILTKDLKSAHEQMAAQQASATPTAALAVPQEDKSWSCLQQMRTIKVPPGAFKLLGGVT